MSSLRDAMLEDRMTLNGVQLPAEAVAAHPDVLTDDALAFVADLQRTFSARRRELLARRAERWARLKAGGAPELPPADSEARRGDWRVADAPADLDDRRVEITGPAEPKMAINALNSGARVFMADLEDALSPTFANELDGQETLRAAVRRTLAFTSPEGKEYRLNDEVATLLVRPRGWHLDERHVTVDGEPMSGSLFDFGLYLFHNAHELLRRGSGPYFYLPKLENGDEAALWNDVFVHAQAALGIPRGTIRATVLIETILAALEMEEILYALREHSAGLNAGRWDYIFSAIKKFHRDPEALLPDRAQVTMTVPFMRAYTELLVSTCHRRGAHAIGGMAAFIPSRRDAEVNAVAMAKVREDKQREAGDGFDGSWVAHPDLVPICLEAFDAVLGERPNQKERLRDDVRVEPAQIVDLHVPGGTVTLDGVRNNVSVGMQYVANWLDGRGAVGIYNLMEDAATAEIARAQLWQWVHHGAPLADGGTADLDLYRRLRDEELERLADSVPHLREAAEVLDRLVEPDEFADFLTVEAYARLG
jgi:malate synthase